MTEDELERAVVTMLARTPEWIRHDLASKDASLRSRAEETLASLIVAAIGKSAPGV